MSADRIDIYIGSDRDEVLRLALGEDVGRIERKGNGKPYIPNGREFNLSHSGDMVICAVSQSPVGIDIELIKEREISRIMKVFSENEKQLIDKANNSEKLREFYHAWTIKEAICKLEGCGISKEKLGEIDYNLPGCFCKSFIFAERYVLTVCAEEKKDIAFHGENLKIRKI